MIFKLTLTLIKSPMKMNSSILTTFLMLVMLSIGFADTSVQDVLGKERLLKQIDDERLAYQLYTKLGEVYPRLRQFQNIPHAESRHFNSLVSYAQTQYSDVNVGTLEGGFLFPETEDLFSELLAYGKQSARNALDVGIRVEELDIEDLESALAQHPEESLRIIYENLKRGSMNHLRAFSKGGKGCKKRCSQCE